uniref:Homeobox domain-containing protein n=1 Tax=Pygocentrus nattereri TaxID=42514 RepID=A0A3B4DVD1_PYGNA
TMARNFTVAWLSQSSHSSTGQEEKALSLDGLQSNGLCLVPPPSQKLCEAQTEETEQTPYRGLQDVNHNAKDVKIKTPSSPTSKYYSTLPKRVPPSCGYTSDSSESEVCEDSEGETGPNRRVRTKFTSYQISRLEETFTRHKYLGATQRKKMAEKLHLSETQVKTWFQNRRMKLKREVQDRCAEYFSPALVSPVLFRAAPSFQHPGMSGQLLSLQLHQQQLNQRVSLMAQQHSIHPTLLLASAYY